MPSDHTIDVYQDIGGIARIRVDAPGISAVSAPIEHPLKLIRAIAFDAGLELVENEDGSVTISANPPA